MRDEVLRTVLITVLIAMLGAGAAKARTTLPNGTILSSVPCPPNPVNDYASYVADQRAYLERERKLAAEEGILMPIVPQQQLIDSLASPSVVADQIAYEGFECRAITYASDGLVIAGFLWKPLTVPRTKLPLIIVNRGGSHDFAGMTPWLYLGWHDFLKAGYIVLASQYRGGPGSEGQDEYGGADLNDVRALIPLAQSLGYVDTSRIFMFGGSRGGMESYLLARSGFPLRAMAILSGSADLFRAAADRPVLEQRFKQSMPDYAAGREAALSRRSAVRWAGELKVPTILFQGSDDWRVSPSDSLDVAQGLQRAKTPYELHLYAGDSHSVLLNERDMITRMLIFFRKFGGATP